MRTFKNQTSTKDYDAYMQTYFRHSPEYLDSELLKYYNYAYAVHEMIIKFHIKYSECIEV